MLDEWMELNSMRTVPRMLRGLWVAVSLLCLIGSTRAEQPIVRDLPPGLQIPAAALTGPSFDVDNATEAYLALLSPEQHKRSDEYFEGGYWLKLWEVLWTVSACLLLLLTGVSNRISQWSQRLSRRSWISTPIFIALGDRSFSKLVWSIWPVVNPWLPTSAGPSA